MIGSTVYVVRLRPPGSAVDSEDYGSPIGDPTPCGEDGGFSVLAPDAEHDFQLSAHAPGVFSPSVRARAGDTDVMLVLPSTSRLVGVVRDEEGQPFGGAHVQLNYSDGSATIRVTDKEGRFVIEMARVDLCTAQAFLPPQHFGPTCSPFSVRKGENDVLELYLPRDVEIRGRCLGLDDLPVPGVLVEAMPDGRRAGVKPQARSNLDGAFALTGLDATRWYTLRVGDAHRLLDSNEPRCRVGDRDVVLRVGELLQLSGKVVPSLDDLGGLDQVTVTLLGVDQGRGSVLRSTCNAAGDFGLTELHPGRYVLQTSGGPYAITSGTILQLEVPRHDVEIPVRPGGSITGIAVDNAGAGVSMAIVEARPSGGPVISTETASDGTFTLAGLDLDEVYGVSATMPGRLRDDLAAIPARAGDHLTVVVSDVSFVVGTVSHPLHANLQTMHAEIIAADGSSLGRVGLSLNDRRFAFALIAPERACYVVLTADDLAPQRVAIPASTGGAHDLGEVVMDEGEVVFGVVQDPRGTPVEGALVKAVVGGQSTLTDARGEFLLPHVSEAVGALRISADGYAPHEVPLGSGAPVTSIRIVMEPR